MTRFWFSLPSVFLLSATLISTPIWWGGIHQELTALPEVAGTIVRTLVYHEITTLPPRGVDRHYPVISGDGSRVAYSATVADVTHVYVANFDGSGAHEVDTFNYGRGLDISYDGSKVLAAYFQQIRVVGSDGGAPVTVWNGNILDGNGFNVRLAPSGNLVFFELRENYSEYPRGLWVVNADGSGLRRIVTPEQVASVLSVPAEEISFYSDRRALDVSRDGTRVIFPVSGRGHHILGGQLSASGSLTNLHQILGPIPYYGVHNAVLSSDGSTVGYDVTQSAGNVFEVGVVNFDGTGRKVVVTSSEISPPGSFPNNSVADYRIFLNRDGSKLLLGGTSYYYDTPTRSVLQLGVAMGELSGDPERLVRNGLFVPSMSESGTRFTYIRGDTNNIEQLATMEITSNLGAAPSLSNPTIDPPFVLTNDRSRVTLTVRATANTGLSRVSAAFLRNGLDDVYICFEDRTKPVLFDNQTQGDVTANDSIHTNNAIHAAGGALAVPGPRVVRYQAETRTGDNRRHVTAIDVESLTVTEQTPLIDVAPTSLEFGDVTVGQSKDLSLTVRNIGGVQLVINSLTIDNARFSTPGTATPITINAGGQQNIAVRFAPTATGQQRGTLTINSSDPARPTITVALAGNGVSTGGGATVLDHTMTSAVPGACAKPAIKTNFASTDSEAIQWTFASGLSVGDAIRWEWVQPNGTVYRTFNHTLAQVTQGQACFWDAISIAGQQAASLPGNWQVRVFIKEAQVLTETFTISRGSGDCPTISGISPSSGGVGTSVTITGAGFLGVSGVRFADNVSASYIVFNNNQLVTTVPFGATTGLITISKPNCSDVKSPISFTIGGSTTSTTTTTTTTGPVTTIPNTTTTFSPTTTTLPTGRIVRAVCTGAVAGGTLSIPIQLVSQGDENALGFSLTFDPAVLSNPQVSKGSDAGNASLNSNLSQSAQGRVGIALALSPNTTFASGIREIAMVAFTVSSATTAATTSIGFGDAPIIRQVSNTLAQVLPANYQGCASIAIVRGYEADVTPRPTGKGDGTIAITDWVQVGRFAAALDTAAAGTEFQKADCAPRPSVGDAQLTIIDWVQAGRYASNLDPATPAGGPTAPSSSAAMEVNVSTAGMQAAATRIMRAVSSTFQRSRPGTLSIELEAQGNENAVGFSLSYDSSLLSYVSATLGNGAGGGLLMVNTNQTANGQLGFALALSAGQQFSAGTKQILTVTFAVASGGSAATSMIRFGDQPIRRQISDATATSLTATFEDATITFTGASAVALYFPQVADGGSYRTTFILYNLSDDAATARLEFFDSKGAALPLPIQGTNTSIRDIALSARGVAQMTTDGVSPDIKVGWARVTCPVAVGGEAIFQTMNRGLITSEAGVASSPPAGRFAVYVRSSASVASGVAFCNPNNDAVTLTLTLRNTLGGVAATTRQNLPALGHIAQFIPQWFGSGFNEFEGSLDVSSSSPISAVALRYDNPAADVFTVLPVMIIF